MRIITPLLLSGLFAGYVLYGEPNKFHPQIGDDFIKGPPEQVKLNCPI